MDGRRESIEYGEGAFFSSPVIADGVVYVGNDDSCLCAFESFTEWEPKAISIDPANLEGLEGVYEASASLRFIIERSGDRRLSARTGSDAAAFLT